MSSALCNNEDSLFFCWELSSVGIRAGGTCEICVEEALFLSILNPAILVEVFYGVNGPEKWFVGRSRRNPFGALLGWAITLYC
jgi:hypothetical protein